MPGAHTNPELAERLREIRERIRKRLERTVPSVPAPSLSSAERLHDAIGTARQSAAAIGTVNPRPPGFVNEVIQMVKEAAARMLEWQVRPQRDFNQSVVQSLERMADLLEANQRQLAMLGESLQPFPRLYQELAQDVDATREYFDERMRAQRWTYEGSLVRQAKAFEERTGKLLEQAEEEMRVLRQRVAAQAKAGEARLPVPPSDHTKNVLSSASPTLDYFRFEQLFRGTEEDIRGRQSFYLPFFRGRKNVLDLACGRGEFLELMRDLQVPARGVDLDRDMAGRCQEKGLDVVSADVFHYLGSVPEGSLDGIFCAHFLEHLPPEAYVELISQCVGKLAPGGVLAIETPNPECLATFSQTFYLDPTHRQPIPPALLRLLFAESGLTQISTHTLSPASANLPVLPLLASKVLEADRLRAWNEAVTRFNETYFGGMDYAVIGYRPLRP